MAFSAGGGSGPKSDMNVVPLIDILLVLLIIGVFGWAVNRGQFDDLERED
jgi:cbb3-type cytochrome oxidase maturation protein